MTKRAAKRHMARFEQPPLKRSLICHLSHFLFVKIITGGWTGEQRRVWWSKSEISGMTTRTQNHQLKRCCSSKWAKNHQKITKNVFLILFGQIGRNRIAGMKLCFSFFVIWLNLGSPQCFWISSFRETSTIYWTKSSSVYWHFENNKKTKNWWKVFFTKSWSIFNSIFSKSIFYFQENCKILIIFNFL